MDVPPASQTQYIQIKIQYLSLLAQFILPPVFPISEEAPSITEGINYFFSLSSIFLLSQMIFLIIFFDYAITVVMIFPLCPPPPSAPTSSGNPPIIVHVHGSCL